MLITCDNKGCFKLSNALYDKDSKDVLCQECGKDIKSISDSMRRTLLSFGQVVRTTSNKGFMMACKKCNANRQVVMDQDKNTLCKQCHGPIVVQKAFLIGMEATGAIERVEISEEPVKKTAKKKASKKKSKSKGK